MSTHPRKDYIIFVSSVFIDMFRLDVIKKKERKGEEILASCTFVIYILFSFAS
jgi:hypothetical protein